MAVNLTGVANCVREATGPMARQGGGRIINIASISAMRGGGSLGNTLYGTSKAGVVALAMGLARELGPSGITVNSVAPSVADTPMTHSTLSDEVREKIIARIPIGRLATPADIADAVTFLASDRASFINGAVLPVDGGILTT
jgi:NAD(P)-dependent dehydrogenase (short-subunit alcohol dehydrogenase family)